MNSSDTDQRISFQDPHCRYSPRLLCLEALKVKLKLRFILLIYVHSWPERSRFWRVLPLYGRPANEIDSRIICENDASQSDVSVRILTHQCGSSEAVTTMTSFLKNASWSGPTALQSTNALTFLGLCLKEIWHHTHIHECSNKVVCKDENNSFSILLDMTACTQAGTLFFF